MPSMHPTFVCYWFEKARAMIEEGSHKTSRAFGNARNPRQVITERVLQRIKEYRRHLSWLTLIMEWLLDGASCPHRLLSASMMAVRKSTQIFNGAITTSNP